MSKQIKKNVEVISLVFKSVKYLHFIAEQLKSNLCKVDGWDVGVRLVANDATPEVLEELKNINIHLENIDIGGGLGIKYTDEDLEPDLQEYSALVKKILGHLNCRIIFEPGRYIVGNCGILVTKVLYKKPSQNKNFLITDAGMNDFSRTALYGATHKLIPLYKKKSGKTGIFDVVGPVCESTDTFLKNYLVEGAEIGDFLAFLDVGAYGAVLSSEYNTRPLVPEIMVYNKLYELVRSRPTYEEIFDRETMPNWE